jgi:hypothetical protein
VKDIRRKLDKSVVKDIRRKLDKSVVKDIKRDNLVYWSAQCDVAGG